MENKMHETRIDLPEKERIEIVGLLNKTLASVLDLYAQLKQAHWNVKGPEFMPLHLLFDTIAEEVEEQADIIAERIMALGGTAFGTIQEIASNTELETYPTNIFLGTDHIQHLTHNVAILGELTSKKIDQTIELNDVGTNDVYVALKRMLDKNLWFLEAHTQK